MSNRQAAPKSEALGTWRGQVDADLSMLKQRRAGSPNGLIVPGGGAGVWVPVSTYGANWSAYAVAGTQPPSYTMDADGFVHLRGHASNSSAWAGTIFTLPAGYQPALTETFLQAAAAAAFASVAVQVAASGAVAVVGIVSGAWAGGGNFLSLSGISFYAGGQ